MEVQVYGLGNDDKKTIGTWSVEGTFILQVFLSADGELSGQADWT